MSLPKTDYALLESWASFCHMKNANLDVFKSGVEILSNDGEYYLDLGFPSLLSAVENCLASQQEDLQ